MPLPAPVTKAIFPLTNSLPSHVTNGFMCTAPRQKQTAMLSCAMRFSIYDRYELEIIRRDDRWQVRRIDGTKQRPADIVVPPDLPADAIAVYLDDLLHEAARPGEQIRKLS